MNQRNDGQFRDGRPSVRNAPAHGSARSPRTVYIVSGIAIAVSVCVIAVVAFLMLSRGSSSGTDSGSQAASAASASVVSSESATVDSASSAAAGDGDSAQSGASTSGSGAGVAVDASAASASGDTAQTSGASSGAGVSAQSETDLSWRDTDFAVDPSRTDWNENDNGRKVVYLTFDDGPSELTQQVLDILDKYGCKATFFVIGLNSDYFPMIKEAYDRGHTIGLHSLTHEYATVYSSVQAYFDDLDGIAAIVRDQIGYVPCFIRFPGGSSNAISADYTRGIMSTLVQEVQARGYQYFDWNVSCGDGSEHTEDELVQYATTEATEYENIVLLMHDSGVKQSTVAALPRVIEYYQQRGYSFEAIDRSTVVTHHGVSN